MVDTEDLLYLIRAVNESDDSVLPIMCDYLEEQGNSMHIGLREIIKLGKIPCDQITKHHRAEGQREGLFSWYNKDYEYSQNYKHYKDPEKELGEKYYNPHYMLEEKHFNKLTGVPEFIHAKDYKTRWEAYTDLARVLAEECK